MKKIDKGREFIQNNLNLFQCPICSKSFVSVIDNSVLCADHHSFDLSKKGTLYFLNHAVNTEYDDAMLVSRRQVLSAGLFDGIVAAVSVALPPEPQTLLDIGTGEGTPFAKLLAQRAEIDTGIAFDISKAGINLATQLSTEAFFAVADLAKLPFADNTFSSIVEFFSPSSYKEFNRVLQPGGELVKVVPNKFYLKELRELLYPVGSSHHTYDNQQVVELFMQNYPNTQVIDVTYQWDIPAHLYVDLLHMTPLHWGARPEAQAIAEQTPLDKVTVDVQLLVTKI